MMETVQFLHFAGSDNCYTQVIGEQIIQTNWGAVLDFASLFIALIQLL